MSGKDRPTTQLGEMRNELITLYMEYDRCINEAKSYEEACQLINRRRKHEGQIMDKYGMYVNPHAGKRKPPRSTYGKPSASHD